MKLPANLPDLPTWAWAGLGFGVVWLLLRPKDAAAAGKAVGQAAVSVADGLFSGVVKGVGGVFGVPDTDAAKCQAALTANDATAASKYCPAGTFIASIPQSLADWLKGLTTQPTAPSAHGYFTGPAPKSTSPVTTPSILNGGSFETQGNCVLLGVDCSVDGSRDFDLGTWIEESNSQNRTLNPITPVAGMRG